MEQPQLAAYAASCLLKSANYLVLAAKVFGQRRINAVSVAAYAKNSAGQFAFFDSHYDVDAQNKKERD